MVSTGRHEADVAAAFGPLATAMRELLTHQADDRLTFLAGFIAELNGAARAAPAAT